MGIKRNGREADKLIFLTFYDKDGNTIGKEWLPHRLLYGEDGKKYIYVTRNNRDHRVFVRESDVCGIPCYEGHAIVGGGTNRSTKVKTSVSVEKDQNMAIRKIAKKDGITFSEALRQVVEWGLEQAEEEYALKRRG